MAFSFQPAPRAHPPSRIETMQDLRDWALAQAPDPSRPARDNPAGYFLQAIRTLQSHCNGAPLCTLPADVDWIAANFPRAKKKIHPRPDLDQMLEPYSKWRADLVRAVRRAKGTPAQALRARQDGWAELLAAVRLHTKDGGLVHPASAACLATFADTARRAGLDPWDLGDGNALEKLASEFASPADRAAARRAQKFLNDFAFLPELAAWLPAEAVAVFPALREAARLPRHVDAQLVSLVEVAATERDEVAGKDSQTVVQTTKDRWLAALRHHVRTLPDCPVAEELGYTAPIRDVSAVNDPAALFEKEHLFATLRRTGDIEHLPGTIVARTACHYYGDLMVVLGRNGLIDESVVTGLKRSRFYKEGRRACRGMTKRTREWCRALATEPRRERRFRNLHRLMMKAATDILEAARAEGRAPTVAEVTKARQLGTCAAACAIEYAGRPIRLANCLGLRLHGTRANLFQPGRGRADWSFVLSGEETKAGQDEPLTPLRTELHGPQVLAWYLREIRPLFPKASESIYLFPAAGSATAPLGGKTFDTWFQRAATAADMPMHFHNWRHGYATLLLAADWNNLPLAADMLGNTVAVCERNYAWINKAEMILQGQGRMIESARNAA